MTVTFRPNTVKALPGTPGRWAEHRDAVVRGLVVRVTPKGVRSYAVVYRYGGRNRTVTLGRVDELALARARELARELLVDVAGGKDPARERRLAKLKVERSALPVTIKDLVEDCLKALDLRDSTRRDWRRIADVEILPRLGARPIAELSRGEVRRWSAAIQERSRHVANTSFKVLRRAYSWGISQDLVETTPFVGLPQPAPEVRNSRWLRVHELRALWRALGRVAAESFYPDVVRLLLLTALRRGEVLGARREEFEGLDGKDPRWIVPAARMKGAREHVVPLSRQAAAIVRVRLKAVKGSCLFPLLEADRPAPWISRFSVVLQEQVREFVREELEDPQAKVERWTIHSLRHTVATHMQDTLQVPDGVVALVLAHRPPGLTDVDGIYLRGRRLDERRQALQRWADWLLRAARAKKGPGKPAERMRSGRQVGDEAVAGKLHRMRA